jgi:hypothetical protein
MGVHSDMQFELHKNSRPPGKSIDSGNVLHLGWDTPHGVDLYIYFIHQREHGRTVTRINKANTHITQLKKAEHPSTVERVVTQIAEANRLWSAWFASNTDELKFQEHGKVTLLETKTYKT